MRGKDDTASNLQAGGLMKMEWIIRSRVISELKVAMVVMNIIDRPK